MGDVGGHLLGRSCAARRALTVRARNLSTPLGQRKLSKVVRGYKNWCRRHLLSPLGCRLACLGRQVARMDSERPSSCTGAPQQMPPHVAHINRTLLLTDGSRMSATNVHEWVAERVGS